MNRQQKEQVIASLRTDLQNSNASFIVGYRGLSVAELVDLRRQLVRAQGKFQVAKVTLIKRAIPDKNEAQALDPYLVDQIALVLARGESPVVAKVICDFAKKHENLKIVAGYFEHKVLTQEAIKTFAHLPSREVLLAQLCGTLKAPMVRLVTVLDTVVARLPVALQQIQKKKSS